MWYNYRITFEVKMVRTHFETYLMVTYYNSGQTIYREIVFIRTKISMKLPTTHSDIHDK